MERKITVVYSPTGTYMDVYEDFGDDISDDDICDYILNNIYLEIENA